jgi:hypothetical protein
MRGDFDRTLPPAIIDAAIRSGNEWLLPLAEAKQAIILASEHLIAILGVELFRILNNGLLRTEGCTGYDFDFQEDWSTYVHQNNDAALQFIEQNQFGQGYGYILTTCSEEELKNLRRS